MDPALREQKSTGHPDDVLEAIIRLSSVLPAGLHEIANFGDIRTVRMYRRDIQRVWEDPGVASLKAPRLLEYDKPEAYSRLFLPHDPIDTRKYNERGEGVVVGVIDWGFDFGHPAFRRSDGSSRIEVMWDQRGKSRWSGYTVPAPDPYGYGRILYADDFNAALSTSSPYAEINYHPGDADRGSGAHGTHVADIAAGSPRANHPGGYAPGSDLVFVHLASSPLGGFADLGDSVRLLEAVDFIVNVAGDRAVAINMSIGRHGGSHTGLSLVERALDYCVARYPGVAIVHSAGNYGTSSAHASGILMPAAAREMSWQVERGDITNNELEIWYSNRDRLRFSLRPPGSSESITAELGDSRVLFDGKSREIGRMYHRANDPNTPDHQIDVILRPNAPAGLWKASLFADEVVDGRFDAWIERDSGGPRRQSHFLGKDVDPNRTIGSIANTFLTITVGAADGTAYSVRPAKFASRGPTRDGRIKPDLMAPGVSIRAARSTPKNSASARNLNTSMSGASQASPAVAGISALCLQAANGQLSAHDLRRVLISSAIPLTSNATAENNLPPLVDPGAAIRLARQHATSNS